MSTLALRTEMLPFDHPWATAGLSAQWYVLHTRSHQETKVAQMLAAGSAVHFLPLVKEARYRGSQKTIARKPLFTGYVFLKGQKADAYPADRNKRIVQILPVLEQEQLECELLNIYQALQADSTLKPHCYGLNVGARVEVCSGPCKGLQGRVESLGSCSRLILSVRMLGRAVSLEIEGSLLSRLE